MWWEPLFCIYWSFLIKYINPAILYYIFMGIFLHDLRNPFNDLAVNWQSIGWSIPILGLLIFAGSFCLFSESDQLNYEEFDLTEFMTDEQLKYWQDKVAEEDETNKVDKEAKDPEIEESLDDPLLNEFRTSVN